MSVVLTYNDLFTILALVLLTALSMSVFIHNRRSPVNRLFSLFLLNVTAWLSLSVVYYLFRDLLVRLLIFQTIIGSFMGLTFYWFSRAVSDPRAHMRAWERALVAVPLAISVWYLFIALEPRLFAEFSALVRYDGVRLHRPGDWPYILYTAWLLTSFIAGYAVMVRGYRGTEDPQVKKRIWHVLTASVVGQLSSLAIVNISSILGQGQSGRLALVPIIGSLFWIGFSIIRDRIWAVEHLLDVIRRSEEKLAERNRIIEADLELARLIQRKLLPDGVPSVPGLAVHAVYQPVEKVGGDYYDFIERDGGLGVMIADVSGHGIASAFLSSIIKMGFHYHGGEDGPGLFTALDALVADKGARAMFATAAFCWLDPAARRLVTCRAGHCPPLLMRRAKGEVLEIEPKGRALGMDLGDHAYQVAVMELQPGDRLLLYTDGIVEAMNLQGELFGMERLIREFREQAANALPEFCSGLLERIGGFAEGGPHGDDITLIAVDVL